MDNEQKASLPPYVPYRTLTNFLERFKQGVPARIDVGLLGSMSGGMRSQLMTSMKVLKLISDAGVPTDDMKKLCAAEGKQREEILQDVITRCYPYLFGNGFDFSTATLPLLREALEEHTNASGETVTRCIAFIKEAAADAGIPVSPFLKDHKPRAGSTRQRKTDKEPDRPKDSQEMPRPSVGTNSNIPAQDSLLLWGLFQRLPQPGKPWAKQEREKWIQTWNNVLALEYPEQ